MNILKTILLIAVAALPCACSSYTANQTTTVGDSAATVDNPTGIANGMTVTSVNVPSGEKVGAIIGNAVTLTLPATVTGTVATKFSPTVQTVAQKFATNSKAYAQTLGNMLQAGLNGVAKSAPTLASLTSFASTLAQSWGMSPVNSQQQATFADVLSTINKVGANATAISTYLTGLQTTGNSTSSIVSKDYESICMLEPGETARLYAIDQSITEATSLHIYFE